LIPQAAMVDRASTLSPPTRVFTRARDVPRVLRGGTATWGLCAPRSRVPHTRHRATYRWCPLACVSARELARWSCGARVRGVNSRTVPHVPGGSRMCTGMHIRTRTSGCASIIPCWFDFQSPTPARDVSGKRGWISLSSGSMERACASAIVAHRGCRGSRDGCWINTRLNPSFGLTPVK
jgi:hypothetical protein